MRERLIAIAIVFTGIAFTTGCDAVERVRSRFGATTTDTVVTTTGSGLTLGLQAPPALRAGEEGLLRLSVTNQTDTAVSQVRLELIVPAWAEPVPPRVGDRPVTMVALETATQFSYQMSDKPLNPGQRETVEQRIRVPASANSSRSNAPWTRMVKGRLLASDGRAVAEVQTDIVVDSAAIAGARTTADARPPNRRERLEAVELGMTATAVKQAVPNTRDTTWLQGGTRERGLLVPMNNRTALAVLSGDAVARIEIGHPATQTAERLGVGSTMSELRAAYGTTCADVIGSRVVVWFANAPGVAFAIDTPAPRNAAQLDAARIPGTAKVTRWWLSRDVDICPTGG